MSNKFLKPPLTNNEKEKRATDFLNFSDKKNFEQTEVKPKITIERVLTKEATKRITMRLPITLAEDIAEISAITGLSMNSVTLELLRVTAKDKLKDLKGEK